MLIFKLVLEFILVNLVDHALERLLHVDIFFGTRFKVLYVVVTCQLFGFLSSHLTFVRTFALVAYENECGVCIAVLSDVSNPSCDRLEGLSLV